jgi:hypothetical protein
VEKVKAKEEVKVRVEEVKAKEEVKVRVMKAKEEVARRSSPSKLYRQMT